MSKKWSDLNRLLRHPLVLPIYVPSLVIAFCRGLLVPVLPLYAQSFDNSFALIGLVVASQGIGTLLGDVPAGVFFSRLGQRKSMLVGLGVLSISMLAMSWARSIPELVLYGLFSGLGTALWNVSRHAYLTEATPVFQRGRAIAIFGGTMRIGMFVGPVIGGTIGAAFSLRAPFVLYAALTAATAIFPALFAIDAVSTIAPRRGGLRGHGDHLWQVIRAHKKTLSSAGTGQFLAQLVRSSRNIIIPLYAAEIIGLDVQAIGWIVGIGAAIDMAMFYPAGIIMDRFGRKFAYVPCFLIQGIGLLLVPLTATFGGLVLASLVIGFGNGLGSGTMMTLGADLAPKDAMGEFLGIWRLIGDSGQSSGPIIVGSIADVVGLAPAAVVAGGFGVLAASILYFFVPETLQRTAPVAVKQETPETSG